MVINTLFLLLFYFFIDRQRLFFMLLVFFISFDIVGLVDEFGKFFNLWCYPHQMLPFTDRFNTVDFAIIPVSIALVYQFFSKWKFFLIAHIVTSAVIAFIGIPVFKALYLYQLLNWTMFYSFLTVFIMGIVVKMIGDWIAGKKKGYSVS
ncbi:CBO0543 family protein [Priestia megaterium]